MGGLDVCIASMNIDNEEYSYFCHQNDSGSNSTNAFLIWIWAGQKTYLDQTQA